MIKELIHAGTVAEMRDKAIKRMHDFADRIEKKDPTAVQKAEETLVTSEMLREAAERLMHEAQLEAAETPDADDDAFMPRSPLTSILQAQIDREAKQREATTPLADPAAFSLAAGQESSPGEGQPLALESLAVGGFEDGEDIRYGLDGAVAVLGRLIRNKHPFNPQPARRAALGNEARVFMFGDWGTGLPIAQTITKQIEKAAKAEQNGRRQHVIHLGDVYYAGQPNEYREHVLPYWPVAPGKITTSYSLNGNHDMYSGGRGYFGTLLSSQRFAAHWDDHAQPSSFFLLENDHWQIFGLDSAYFSPELTGMTGAIDTSQADFVWHAINEHDGEKGVILLSHHQLFSARPKEKDSSQIRQALIDRGVWDNVDAWIWGHEHRCVEYKPNAKYGLKFGMCLGQSGVPVRPKAEKNVDQSIIEFEYQEPYLDDQGKQLLRLSYAAFDFSAAKPNEVAVTIFNDAGKPVRTTKIVH